jgi:hypothetical protein
MYIFPYDIVTVALSRLAGFSPPRSAPVHVSIRDRADEVGLYRIDLARLRGVQVSLQLSGWSLR